MKAVKNCIKTLTLILGLGMLFCAPISRASNITYQQVEMGVYCYSANSGAAIADSQFELYAADNIRDVDGNIVLGKDTLLKTSTTDSSGCASFAMTLPVGRYYAKQTSVNSSYVMQDFKIYFYVTEGVSSYRENLYLPTNTSNLDLRASVPAEVVANGEYNITVGAIGNLSETNANNMVYTQNMPYNTRMVGLSTGLYNADATIGVYYKTNCNSDWQYYTSVNSADNLTIDFGSVVLGHNEYIGALMLTYGTVPPGFAATTPPVITVQAGLNARYGDSLTGEGALTAYFNGVKATKNITLTSTVSSITTIYVAELRSDSPIDVTIVNQNLQQMENNPGTEVITGTGAGSGLSDATIRTGDETPLGKYTLFIVLGSMAALISGYILVITNKSKKEK